jgi:hypothetical protein
VTATVVTPHVTITPITPQAPTAPSVVAKMNANCREGPSTAYDVYGNLLAGQRAEVKGRLEDNSWLLIALLGRSANCWIASSVADVQGDLGKVQTVAAGQLPPPAAEQPPSGAEEPPAVDVLPPGPLDTTPPSFYSVGASPQEIITAGGGCASYPRKVTIAAALGDDGGIGSVTAHWNIGGAESGQVAMGMGGLGYYSEIGPVNTAGTMQIYVIGRDTSGNSQTSQTVTVSVSDCPG